MANYRFNHAGQCIESLEEIKTEQLAIGFYIAEISRKHILEGHPPTRAEVWEWAQEEARELYKVIEARIENVL